MIDLNNYPLMFHHLETKRTYPGRRTMNADYVLIDTDTGQKLPITQWELKKNFRSDPSNKKRRGAAFRKCKKISA